MIRCYIFIPPSLSVLNIKYTLRPTTAGFGHVREGMSVMNLIKHWNKMIIYIDSGVSYGDQYDGWTFFLHEFCVYHSDPLSQKHNAGLLASSLGAI